MNRQTTTPKSYTKEAGLTEAGDKEEAETADLRKAPKNYSSISMGQTLATEPTNVPKRRKPSKRMEVEKKAKLVVHTSWPTQPTQPFQTPQLPYNPPFQPIPAFSYNPYPANWQPPQSKNARLPHQPINRTTREELPPPPPGPPPKQENQNTQNAQSIALPTFGMIMPISGRKTQNKKRGLLLTFD